jgi:hypothetical protein
MSTRRSAEARDEITRRVAELGTRADSAAGADLRGSTERITMRGVVRSVSPIHFGSALEKCLNPAA